MFVFKKSVSLYALCNQNTCKVQGHHFLWGNQKRRLQSNFWALRETNCKVAVFELCFVLVEIISHLILDNCYCSQLLGFLGLERFVSKKNTNLSQGHSTEILMIAAALKLSKETANIMAEVTFFFLSCFAVHVVFVCPKLPQLQNGHNESIPHRICWVSDMSML